MQQTKSYSRQQGFEFQQTQKYSAISFKTQAKRADHNRRNERIIFNRRFAKVGLDAI